MIAIAPNDSAPSMQQGGSRLAGLIGAWAPVLSSQQLLRRSPDSSFGDRHRQAEPAMD
jgi:hypothetical protein